MNPTRVAVFTPLNRLAIASGVPRHIIEVVGGMLEDPSLDLEFFANREEAERYLPVQGDLWNNARRVTFEPTVARMVRQWGIFNRPSFEALGGEAEWLYLPADGYVTTTRAKLAATIHDVYKLEPPVPGENRLDHYRARLRHYVIYRRLARNAERILTVSRFSADRIMHHLGVPASRIDLVYNGVSDSFFAPDLGQWDRVRVGLGLRDDEPYFVYMGGLKAKKNGPGIISAWRRFEARHPQGRLVILGHHDEAMLAVAKRDLARAHFPTGVSDGDLAVLLARSAALFFPSFYEGFGIPVVEAFAAGTTVVVSDIPALRELASDLAIYVDPRSPDSMVAGLERCLSEHDERPQRIAAGRSLAANFTWEEVVRRVKKTFI